MPQPGPATDVAQVFAAVAGRLAATTTAAGARDLLVTEAREALGSAGTALWHLTPKTEMALDSSTDPEFMAVLANILAGAPDGPAWQALQDRRTTIAHDFESETRWPAHTRRLVAETPVRSVVVYPLGIEGRDLGILAAYAHEPHFFEPSVVEFGAVFAACASLALENAALREKTRNLEMALTSSRHIGMAVGILMARNNLTEMQAFDLLRVTSNNVNTKLADVADHVLYTGAVADMPTR